MTTTWKASILNQAATGPIVLISIGLPGSGKSTLLKPLAAELDAAYVNRDDTREELLGDPTDHTKEQAVTVRIENNVRRAIRQRRHVIIDATNNNPRSRIDWIKFTRKLGAEKIIGLYVNTDALTSLQRNKDRSRTVPDDVMERMHSRLMLNPPNLTEGFDLLLQTTGT